MPTQPEILQRPRAFDHPALTISPANCVLIVDGPYDHDLKMLARHQSWATTMSMPTNNMHPDTTIRVAMAAGLRSTLVLFRGPHTLSAHDSTQPGVSEGQALKSSHSTSRNTKMGNIFSKHRNRSNQNGYATVPAHAPGVDNRPYAQHPSYSQKIDPRDQRRPQYQHEQQYQQPQPYQQPQQYTQPPPPSTVAHPTGWRRPGQQAASQPPKPIAPRKIKAEYLLQVTCLHCEKGCGGCPITPNLNGNVLQGRRKAYRDPANAGGAQPWTLAVDFCSFGSRFSKSKKAETAITRVCKGIDRAYEDRGIGSTYGGGGAKPGMFGRGGDKIAPSTGPFHVDALLDALDEVGVEYESSV
ncbi:hypothetical protein F5144DRAFT_624254 [Chaetomium tenue]|uniref:Uncharacterized protein n=1 Tax=Chaetomium tenue TaxID=1854479 RepID=A0ACB7NZG5_9PEZI|nr:hypothetical protein F5144DRAFT_624254 [Chaetomium globosum]